MGQSEEEGVKHWSAPMDCAPFRIVCSPSPTLITGPAAHCGVALTPAQTYTLRFTTASSENNPNVHE